MAENTTEDSAPTGNRKRSLLPDIALGVFFLLGLCVLLYPVTSNWYNSLIRAQAIASYEEALEQLTPEDFSKIWEEVEEYNRQLTEQGINFRLSQAEQKRYESLLDIGGTGMIGYISIPKLRVKLPIYHGVSDEVLQIAVGHIPGSSLPAGGETTHTVLSAHRGLPSSKLFTDLDQMGAGDTFAIHVLDRVFAYQVDDIRTVEPQDVSSLTYTAGHEQATLVTCTPYAINTHRLLVRGQRTEYSEDRFVPTDAVKLDPVVVSTVIVVPVFIAIFLVVLFKQRTTYKPKHSNKHSNQHTDKHANKHADEHGKEG